MLVTNNELFSGVLSEYSRISPRLFEEQKWYSMSEDQLWHELCLCILSSNVPYEMALSSLKHLQQQGYLSIEWVSDNPQASELIAEELSKPICFPRKKDGSLRKYRFPNMRAKNIVKSARIIGSIDHWLLNLLMEAPSEQEARLSLTVSISGFGLKEASHFLRNIGYSKKLAIIDTHIISFLQEMNGCTRKVKALTPPIYAELEDMLKEICSEWGLLLPVFDTAIWRYMRRRAVHCE